MKAYVINLKKIAVMIFMTVVLTAVIISLLTSPLRKIISDRLSESLTTSEFFLKTYPVFSGILRENKTSGRGIIEYIINEDLSSPDKTVVGNFPVFSGVKEKLSEIYTDVYESNSFYKPNKKKEETGLPETEEPKNVYKAIETTSPSIKANGSLLEQKGITVKNHTAYNPDYEKLYNESVNIGYKKDEIRILIVHTHGSESYNPDDRSENKDANIVRVGKEMAKVFREKEIGVVHSEIMHDIPRFNSSYSKSLETINKELGKHKGINIVLDVHRDAMIAENGDSYKVVCDYKGEKVAQIMFVVGTDGNGLSHPNWKENLKLAMKFQEAVNKKCPNLARPIDLRNERFNQQTTNGTLIIEVGTNGNTLNEAIKGGVLAAEAIAEFIKNGAVQ